MYCFRRARNLASSLSFMAALVLVFAGTSFVSAQTTFPANAPSLGAIPDGPGVPTACGVAGADKDVTFTVTGMSGAVTNVSVSMTFGPAAHTWSGDLRATLVAPNAASQVLFANRGAATATACGSSNDIGGLFAFNDAAALTNFFSVATNPVPPGTYRTSAALTGVTTTMNPAFTGVANANGTWTLRLVDSGGGDTGGVSAASLTLTAGPVVVAGDPPLDYNGDGKTDYVVVRNTGGGPTGQISWLYQLNGTSTFQGKAWGIATDFFLSGNWDTDANDDIAVWRSGSAGIAAFYILRSSDNTALVEPFGQTGDDPTVVDDYSGDGRTDFAVYRSGAGAGEPSTWFWRSAATPGGAVAYVPWGQNGDFVAPGDYDGDGKADYVVQRNNGGGQAAFWRNLTTAADDVVVFGTPTDVVVPGDYDGDGKTDIAVIRGISGQINWFWHPSSGGADVLYQPWGNSASDSPTQGDYDGDGKTDLAIWRPNADPTMVNFWSRGSIGGAVTVVEFGQNGDYPVANYNSH
jgi:hypothetical protein